MIDRTILNRYTRAFIRTVIEKKLLERIEGQLAEADKILKENPSLGRFLRNPLIAQNRKKALLARIFGESLDPLLKDFLFLLVDKRREDVIPFVYDEFTRLADEERNIVRARVESAFALSSRQVDDLKAKLSEITGKKIMVSRTVSPGIIGGLVITLGSRIIDASLAGRLNKAREYLLESGGL